MDTRFGSNGIVRSAHFDRPGGVQMQVTHGLRGERRIETVRADHTRVVSWAPHHGYVERPFRPGYVSRTYIFGGRTDVHVYRNYYYRGANYYGYVPRVYYGPRFYGWAWNPWPAPVVYDWGWRRHPWFDYYGGYFTPAPAYPTAALWLTDYLLAENVQLAWENRQAALALQNAQQNQAAQEYSSGGVILTPEIKNAIADEVRQQIGAEYGAANQPASPAAFSAREQTPSALEPNQRLFVVSMNLTVDVAGEECDLTPGDIIVRANYATISPRNTVNVKVLKSKPGDCPANATADVDLATLQEMRNQFQAHIDSGLKILAEKQGNEGLPAAPAPEARPSMDGELPEESAGSVDTELAQQQQEARQALQEVQQVTAGNN
jgi:hypothetical protein